jgi:hypothetical protein
MRIQIHILVSLFLSFGTIIAQNGTQPDSARVIVGSQANISVDVLLNDNLNASKDYELISVYKSTTSTSVNISTNGSKAQYQDPQGTTNNDTFFYVVRDKNTSVLDTNYVVVRKSDLIADLKPGDANNDNICNNLDVLNIGVAYSQIGISREGIFKSTNWGVVKAFNWNGNFSFNYKFADANGDGIVDSTGDIATVYKNYNQSLNIPNQLYSPLGGKSFVLTCADTFKVSNTDKVFQIQVALGASNDRVSNSYGIAFTVQYDTNFMKAQTIKFKPSNWFMNNTNVLQFTYNNSKSGEFDIAISQKNGINSSGGGEMGIIEIVIEDVLGLIDGVKPKFNITKALMVDSSMNKLPLTLPVAAKEVVVKKLTSKIVNTSKNNNLKAFYSNQNVVIETLSFENEIAIYNILGKEVSKLYSVKPGQKYNVDFSGMSSGIYLIKSNDTTIKLIKP